MKGEDKVEIQELTARYANAMDDTDLDSWMATWDANGLWKGGLGDFQGTDKLKKLFAALGERIKNRRHVMTNFVIEGDDAQATQRCYMLVFDRVNEARLIASGVYNDRLIKSDGKWKFLERRVALDPSFRP
ncbi:MAG TPA: nuclear transport factor 2 family protein [Candidatus Melainabacteria bacterium]|nr:nuclear transport factor 2 family protein [Candidatus Melainabacteria bacterium]HIN67167.1 nuclear transport factor 2 family protein [Candidatus Obscuribacterales bacterium]